MPLQRPRSWMLAILAPSLVIAFVAGAMADRTLHAPHPGRALRAAEAAGTDGQAPDFSRIHEAWQTISREYVDRPALNPETLTAGAISGMVDALGDTGHSTYLSPEMVQEERSLMRGEYVGVGIEISQDNGRVVIVTPFDGSPALEAGLHRGEQILRVDGRSVDGLGISQVVDLIAGPAGTAVRLSILDPVSGATSDVALKRAHIRMHSVSWQVLPGSRLADVRVATFGSGVSRELSAALREIAAAKVDGVLLDLRNNPGGELGEAVDVASQFLTRGDVLQEKDALGKISHDRVRRGGAAVSVPLVVLINNGTASGAEIVAGALQDARRAPLVGETTFGTGTVLTDFPLSDGSELLLAVREWLTPAGRTVWHKGITPDTVIALPADAPLVTPESLKGMTATSLAASRDEQLKKALTILASLVGKPGSLSRLATKM